MVRTVGKVTMLAILFGTVLYMVVHLLASQGDTFKFVERTIMNSQDLRLQVGNIEQVRLTPLGFYHEENAGEDIWATMTVEVFGTTETVTLDVSVTRQSGVWRIEKASIEGHPLRLN